MKNMDELAKQKAEIVAKINQAVKDGNEEAFSESTRKSCKMRSWPKPGAWCKRPITRCLPAVGLGR